MMQVIEGSFVPLPKPVRDKHGIDLYCAEQMTAYAKACFETWSTSSTAQLEDARHQGYLEGLRDANAGIAAEREANDAGRAPAPILRDLLNVAYANGWSASGEGYNYEYPGRNFDEGRWFAARNKAVDVLVDRVVAPAPTPPTFDRDSAEAWMLRAQVSLKQKQFGAAQMEIENALNILRPKE